MDQSKVILTADDHRMLCDNDLQWSLCVSLSDAAKDYITHPISNVLRMWLQGFAGLAVWLRCLTEYNMTPSIGIFGFGSSIRILR